MESFQTVLLLRRRRIAKSGIWCFNGFFRVQFRISSADSAGSVYAELASDIASPQRLSARPKLVTLRNRKHRRSPPIAPLRLRSEQ